MDYLVKFTGFISRLSYSNLKLARITVEEKRVQEELGRLSGDLEKRVIERTTELSQAQAAYQQANRKLNLLSSITRHDINNQLLALDGFLEILHREVPDPAYKKYFNRIEESSRRISGMIQFTKEYEQIGVNAPVWQNCRTIVETAAKYAPLGHVILKNELPAGAEMFADPLIVRVWYNLMDNAVRYGERSQPSGFPSRTPETIISSSARMMARASLLTGRRKSSSGVLGRIPAWASSLPGRSWRSPA